MVCYADDFILFGYKTNLIRAVKKVSRIVKEKFGLEIKGCWTIISFPSTEVENYSGYKDKHQDAFIDMMGFKIYRHHTTIRKKIFRRARR